MNKTEVAYLMAIIKTSYPEYYRQTSEIEDAVNIWSEMLIDDDARVTGMAVKHFIKTDIKGYPPKIGQIRGIAADIKHKEYEERKKLLELPEPDRDKEPMPEDIKHKLKALLGR